MFGAVRCIQSQLFSQLLFARKVTHKSHETMNQLPPLLMLQKTSLSYFFINVLNIRMGKQETDNAFASVFIFPRPRDSVKAIKKRIVGNKNVREIMLALTVSNYL